MPDTGSVPAKVSKKEAVRRAIASMGEQATRLQIQTFVKEQFGLDMSGDHISAAKSEILRQLAAEKQAPTETPAQPTETPTAEVAPTRKVTKAEAVREAVRRLGKKATVAEIQVFVKDNFGHVMSSDHITSARSKFLIQLSRKKKVVTRAAPVVNVLVEETPPPVTRLVPVSAPQPVPVEPVSPVGGASVQLDELLTLKALVERIGVEQLRMLIGVVSGR